MDFIGSIPKPIWDKALEISRKESFPEEQPEDCPYIILARIKDKQLLALTGTLKRQHIDLYLTDVFPPGDIVKYTPPEPGVKHKANRLIWELISKALTSFLHTSSINNQTHTI